MEAGGALGGKSRAAGRLRIGKEGGIAVGGISECSASSIEGSGSCCLAELLFGEERIGEPFVISESAENLDVGLCEP